MMRVKKKRVKLTPTKAEILDILTADPARLMELADGVIIKRFAKEYVDPLMEGILNVPFKNCLTEGNMLVVEFEEAEFIGLCHWVRELQRYWSRYDHGCLTLTTEKLQIFIEVEHVTFLDSHCKIQFMMKQPQEGHFIFDTRNQCEIWYFECEEGTLEFLLDY